MARSSAAFSSLPTFKEVTEWNPQPGQGKWRCLSQASWAPNHRGRGPAVLPLNTPRVDGVIERLWEVRLLLWCPCCGSVCRTFSSWMTGYNVNPLFIMLEAAGKGNWMLPWEASSLLKMLPAENGLWLWFFKNIFVFFSISQIRTKQNKESKGIFNVKCVYLMVVRKTLHKMALRDWLQAVHAFRMAPPRTPATTLLFGFKHSKFVFQLKDSRSCSSYEGFDFW